jgi:anti-sigma B factor antagonist
MTVRERHIGEVTVIDVDGRVTEDEGAALLCDAVQRLAHAGRIRIVLDLGSTSYVDSAAMGEIVRGYTTVTRRGGALRLLHVHGRVQDLLTITRLRGIFEIFDDERDALASFR